MVKLRFSRAWRGYAKGQTADVPGGLAQQLLAQRVAVEDHQGTLLETAALETQAETADATPRRRRKSVRDVPDASRRNSSGG
jgi:hypothetical protein